MDSGSSSARGGHVIIEGRKSADSYDKSIAEFISGIFPGRAASIVGRDDLANPRRATVKGYGYRLVEFGFISNSTDIGIFNSKMDDIASGILNAFGIGTTANSEKKGEIEMKCLYTIDGKQTVYYFNGEKIVTLTDDDQMKVLQMIYEKNNGHEMPFFRWTSKAPWYTRLAQVIALKK